MKRLAFAMIALFSLSDTLLSEEKVTLIVPNAQCEECTESISNMLFLARATPGDFKLETKRITMTFAPTQITIHQLMQAVYEVPGIHGKPYVPYLLVEVKDLEKSLPKLKSLPKKIRGIAKLVPVNTKKNELAILLAPITVRVEAKDYITLAKLAESFDQAGVKFKGLGTSLEDKKDDPKKKASQPKKKSPSKQPKSKAQNKTVPRFQILAFAGGKVYLVDNEATPKLKKFVAKGDPFGTFTVTDLDSRKGTFVELQPKGSSTKTRIER